MDSLPIWLCFLQFCIFLEARSVVVVVVVIISHLGFCCVSASIIGLMQETSKRGNMVT